MLKIDKVGIEIELSSNLNIHNLSEYGGIKVHNYKEFPVFQKYGKATFGLQKEYYSNQLEINIPWCNPDLKELKNLNTSWLNNLTDLYLTASMPKFVGTHIHLLIQRDGVSINKKLANKKMIIFAYLLKKIYEDFMSLLIKIKTSNLSFQNKIDLIHLIKEELFRLVNNHNILIYADYKFFKGELDNIKKKILKVCYHYTNGIDKPKYQPILWSEANPTKPLSLEIRYLPNTLAILPGWSKKTLTNIELLLNRKSPKNEVIEQEVFYYFHNMIGLYINLDSWLKSINIQASQVSVADWLKLSKDFI